MILLFVVFPASGPCELTTPEQVLTSRDVFFLLMYTKHACSAADDAAVVTSNSNGIDGDGVKRVSVSF